VDNKLLVFPKIFPKKVKFNVGKTL